MKRILIYLLLLFSTFSCGQKQISIDNIENIPSPSADDEIYADVYQPLDGTWKGEFLIYEDTNLKTKDQVELEDIGVEDLNRAGLKQINAIQVTQVYKSISPYFQKVTITDIYPDSDKKEVSNGVNKIQNGKMWCVVRKPNETVIHSGKSEGNTIFWSRNEPSPQRIEFFKETVLENSYEIIGWGYYEGDDPKLSPKLWFYAKYQRQ
ncbi:MAG: hypothetical protein AAFN93_00525 [Bacteroidota bacterium]